MPIAITATTARRQHDEGPPPKPRQAPHRTAALLATAGLLMTLGLPAPSLGAEGTPCTSDPQTIGFGSLIICAIDPIGDIDTYRFSATAGQTIEIHVTRQGGGRPQFCLYRPDGSQIGCPWDSQSASTRLTPNQTGTHTIQVLEAYRDATLAYALSLERIAPLPSNARPIQNTDLLSDEINPVGDIDPWFFNVCGTSTWTIQMTRTSGGRPQFCLYRPDGSQIRCPWDSHSASTNATLDQPGPYLIRANEAYMNSTLGYNLSLNCIAGDCRNQCPDDERNCFASGTGAGYLKVCVNDNATLDEFQSPAGAQQLAEPPVGSQLPILANREGYALCSGWGKNLQVHGYDAGLDAAGFDTPTVVQPSGPGTFPLTIIRDTVDGRFQLTQKFTRDANEKDFTVRMTVTNRTDAPIRGIKLARYFNGDIDGSPLDDRFDRTLDSVWGTQGPTGHGLALFARSGIAHTTRIEYASLWNPALCDVPGIDPAGVPDDYVGRLTYNLGTINAGASKTIAVVYRRQ